jgi:ADP-dependent NAD(P)H-hydrate dehydratase / NAD(P)H-hydrate epimerase
MRPVVTSEEMRAADDDALQTAAHEVLVERAGLAAAIAAVQLVPRVYGTPVAVLCGPGSNGADGRVVARHLAARGADVRVHGATPPPERLDGVALVVDAAFGTGLSRRFDAPSVDPEVPVLAVDVPSGIDPDTGIASGDTLRATRTVAMGALKRGHLLADGALLSGRVTVAPIGIDVRDAACALIEDDDLVALPALGRDEHKWRRAVVVVAGSPGMLGAPALAADGALAVQAGMVLLCVPDVPRRREGPWPREVVRLTASAQDAEKVVVDALDRARALVIGPGLGRSARLERMVHDVLRVTREAAVVDADALHLVDADLLLARQERGGSPVILTPHDGEYAALFGSLPGSDRIAAAQHAATRTGCTVLLKGPTTIVASATPPPGLPGVLAVTSGTPDLATPGSGDVLSGVIGGLLARGVGPHLAAALGAHLHGLAGAVLGRACRATALPGAVTSVLVGRSAPRS